MLKMAVLVSGGGTNLQALIDAKKSGKIRDGEFVLVLSDKPEAYALTRAKENGIPTAVVQRKKGEAREIFEQAVLAELRESGAELIVLAGFMRILSEDFIKACPPIINIHPSLIPAFCGAGFYGLRVHEAALEYGVKVTGATVHFVNEIPDGGKIILQKAVDVLEGDTPQTLQRRVMEEAEWKLLPEAVEKVIGIIQKERNE